MVKKETVKKEVAKKGAKRKKSGMVGAGRTMTDDGPAVKAEGPGEKALFASEENIVEKIARAASGGPSESMSLNLLCF